MRRYAHFPSCSMSASNNRHPSRPHRHPLPRCLVPVAPSRFLLQFQSLNLKWKLLPLPLRRLRRHRHRLLQLPTMSRNRRSKHLLRLRLP